MIKINLQKQTLILLQNGQATNYVISTAKNGAGEVENSFCTPRGKHKIGKKIGKNLPINSILIGRKTTGKIYDKKIFESKKDWILSRILWLDGCEEFNKNTKDRYIYIHGAPDEVEMGVALSKGCIRMTNKDVIDLFDKVDAGTKVLIEEG